ncbi:hypothetical protein DFQ28_005464 [Apophysomyces sp. BC1034]|nr:hypothetical protein DFQ28_005464 [Apophysomyces sp. BC1034]
MTFGTDLKASWTLVKSEHDNVPAILEHVENGVHSLQQYRNFVKERASIEKEYAQKLENLAKKYKPNSKTSPNEAAKDDGDWNETGSTSLAAWFNIVAQTESTARTRYRLSEELTSSVAEALKATAARKEEARKKYAIFYQKLKSEKDKTYIEKDKAKQTYDDRCAATENLRAKLSKGTGDQEKYQRQLEQTILECNNSKNLYLLSLGVCNAERNKYHEEDIPTLADHLEDFDNSRILALQDILLKYIDVEVRTLTSVQRHYENAAASVKRIDPAVDASVFIRDVLGSGGSSETPANVQFTFLPWNGGSNAADTIIDRDGTLVINDLAVIFLNNKLVKNRKLLDQLGDELSLRSTEIAQLEAAVGSANKASAEYDQLQERLLNVTRHLALLSTQKVRVKSEIDIIIQSIGDEGLRAQTHEFKSSSFTIPTSCDYCGTTIWGLSNKGLTCKICGFNCHAKCEMKVALNCSRTKGKINRQPSSVSSLSLPSRQVPQSRERNDSISTTRPSTEVEDRVTTMEVVNPEPIVESAAVALYDYSAQSAEELTITEGEHLILIESDDGSGWIKARNHSGHTGLVPANYLNLDVQFPEPDQTPFVEDTQVPPPSQTELPVTAAVPSPEYVVAIYDFEAVNAEELDIQVGDKILVTKKDDSGWWEGVVNGKTGIFPANYVN